MDELREELRELERENTHLRQIIGELYARLRRVGEVGDGGSLDDDTARQPGD